MSTAMVTYLAVYVITIIYFVVLGCRMLWHKDNPLSSHGELAPFLLLAAWQIITPPENDILLYISAALSLASYLFLLIKFASEYRLFLRRLRSEYSDTTSREIALRIEYAYRLMQDNPHLSLRKVAEQSGFRSQPTFRKAFQEVMGCLPSEVKK